ncbi:MAG: hypothetical protein Q8K18_04105 [Burkholderiales bacterium]|nr:hypothetical protein [Burkholderiales bacterium]
MGCDSRASGSLFEPGIKQVAGCLAQQPSIIKHFDKFKDRGPGLVKGKRIVKRLRRLYAAILYCRINVFAVFTHHQSLITAKRAVSKL